jgi:hypothetical protein
VGVCKGLCCSEKGLMKPVGKTDSHTNIDGAYLVLIVSLQQVCDHVLRGFAMREQGKGGSERETSKASHLLPPCNYSPWHTANGLCVEDLCNGVEDVVAELIGSLLVAAIQSDERDLVIRGICALDGGVQSHLKAVIEGAVTAIPVATALAATAADVSGGNEPSEYVQKEQILADQHIQKRLEIVTEELEDAYTMHDAILLELQTKNKEYDELQFQVQDAMHAVDRVKVLEEELESLHGMEIKFVKMKADCERFKEALDEAKPRLQELATLQVEHTSVLNIKQEQAATIEILEARVKQYRINVSSSELKLSGLKASMERKDVELSRLVQTKNALTDEVKSLKASVASLEDRLSTREQVELSAGNNIDADGQVADAEHRAQLEEECARLRQALAGKQDHNIEVTSLEDRIADAAAFAAGLETNIKAQTLQNTELEQALDDRDEQIQNLDHKLEKLVMQIENERIQNSTARQGQSNEILFLKAEVQTYARQAETAQVGQKHLETQLRMVKKQEERRLSNVTQTFELNAVTTLTAKASPLVAASSRPHASYSHPPQASDANVGPNYPQNVTDAVRIAELQRRNKARPAHLRSSHALEMQEQKETSAFWGQLQSSAYELSPTKKEARSPVQQAQFQSQLQNIFVSEEGAPALAFAPMSVSEREMKKQSPIPSTRSVNEQQLAEVRQAKAFEGSAVAEQIKMPKSHAFAVAEPKSKAKMPNRMAQKMAEAAQKKEAKLAKMREEKHEEEAAGKAKAKQKKPTKYSNVKSKFSDTRAPVKKETTPKDENALQSMAKVGSTKAASLNVPAVKPPLTPGSGGRGRQLPNLPSTKVPVSPTNFVQLHRGVSSPYTTAGKDMLSCTMKSTGKSTPLASRSLNTLADDYGTPAR